MSFITTKFHAILLSGFSGVVLTNCFSSIFHFRQISKFKKGHCSQNFLWICTSTHYVLHYYRVSGNSAERFQRSCANNPYWVVSFILAKFLSSKSFLKQILWKNTVKKNSLHSEERCHLLLITSVNDLPLPLTRCKYAHRVFFAYMQAIYFYIHVNFFFRSKARRTNKQSIIPALSIVCLGFSSH